MDQINGVAIEGAQGRSMFAYFTGNLAGGDDSFVESAANIDAFGDAIGRKLQREILINVPNSMSTMDPVSEPSSGAVPEPNSILTWLGLGLVALVRHKWLQQLSA